MDEAGHTLLELCVDEYERLEKYFRSSVRQQDDAPGLVHEVCLRLASLSAERQQAIGSRRAYVWIVARSVLHQYLERDDAHATADKGSSMASVCGNAAWLAGLALCIVAGCGLLLAIIGELQKMPGLLWVLLAIVTLCALAEGFAARPVIQPRVEPPHDPQSPQPPGPQGPRPRPSAAMAMPVPEPPLRTRAVASMRRSAVS